MTAVEAQLHFDLLVSTKVSTELATEDFTALVSVGKSLFAARTSVVTSILIIVSCDVRPLIPGPEVTLAGLLTEFSRLVRSEQYTGLLLPQLASAISASASTIARALRTQARRIVSRSLSAMPFNSLQNTVERLPPQSGL
jgi:hypothetical protein